MSWVMLSLKRACEYDLGLLYDPKQRETPGGEQRSKCTLTIGHLDSKSPEEVNVQ